MNTSPLSMYEQDLQRRRANYVPLTPVAFLARAAHVYGNRVAEIHGERQITYAQMQARCRQLASALAAHGVGRDDTVAIIAPNIPAMLEAHYGVPMLGAVLCPINIRLDAAVIAFILHHSLAKVFIVDREFAGVAQAALAMLEDKPFIVHVDDPLGPGGPPIGAVEYEAFLAGGDPGFAEVTPVDEWAAIALNYTSGTTGDPKGVVVHHRGAYLNACAMAIDLLLNPRSVYLWTLPMFHCNGWTFTWAVTMVGGTHVCLRRVEPGPIFAAIAEHGVTHMCGAPIVLSMLIHAPAEQKRALPNPAIIVTGGAAPPSPVIAAMEGMGFTVKHVYGLTEVYGPATFCAWQPGLEELPIEQKAAFMSRQGVANPMLGEATVLDPETMQPVPADGATIGEVMLRGNTVCKGYLKNKAATEAAFEGGWFHSGDLGVIHPDGYIQIRDRSKDIIISGGENISSLEVEEALYKHPAVMEAAVVAHPDEKWGETPHAFVTLKPGASATAEEIIAWCREQLARFKCPRHVTFGPLPKTSTGKIQKFNLRKLVTS